MTGFLVTMAIGLPIVLYFIYWMDKVSETPAIRERRLREMYGPDYRIHLEKKYGPEWRTICRVDYSDV